MQLRVVLVLLSITISSISYCQRRDKIILKEKTTLLRFNITSLMDPIETNFSLGAEYKMQDRWSTSLDLGYIFQSQYYEEQNSVSGIIIRPAVRYYFGTFKRGFLESEFNYKRSITKITDWLGKACVNNVPSYDEYQTFKLAKTNIGMNFKIGIQSSLSKNGKFWLESYTGIGIRQKTEKVVGEENSCYNRVRLIGLITNEQQVVTLPSLALGLRFMYRL